MSTDNKPNGILHPPQGQPESMPCLVIAFNKTKQRYEHTLIPGSGATVQTLVNHIELVKMQLIMQQMGGVQRQPGLVLPDGSPAPTF